ncbi:hypothetical protein [Clostridium ganghwense]|uniref:Uncharacterized protein n=1 Tax=Clostridium ganghwense TaxID=312089 RepID=A0ABT4CTN3_9CLOT|nr:hypothetical protein [Clostridium ganghwense]MCY6372439.1 hypothetical protein [Clostridium ganghwense]
MLEITAGAIALGIVIISVFAIDIVALVSSRKISDKEYEKLERPDLIRMDKEE